MRVRLFGRALTLATGGVLLADGSLGTALLGGAFDYVVSAVVALGILIFIHELGHFLVAKAMGVGVERFSLGFGPRIFSFRGGETEYCVSIVPLGGYVKMTGEEAHGEDAIHPANDGPPPDPAKSFAAKPLWSRALIVFAGPGMNFVLAAAIFAVMFVAIGVPIVDPTIGRVTSDSPAAQAGLRPRDQVVTLDGKPVEHWGEIEEAVAGSNGRPLAFTIVRDGVRQDATVTPRKVPIKTPFNEPAEAWSIGARPYAAPVIGEVRPGMPAAVAGLQPRDRILAINGQAIETWDELAEAISSRADETITLRIERAGSRMDVPVTPKVEVERDALGNETKVGRIGIATATSESFKRYGPATAVIRGVVHTWDVTAITAVSMWKLVTGKIPASNLGGPIQIGIVVGQAAQQGLARYAELVAAISINLAILNLLPVPMLDGGHLLFFAIEAVLGRPLSLRKREIAQQVGLALLLLLMGFALYNDVWRVPAIGKLLR
jgi:regulator of sigma E protease